MKIEEKLQEKKMEMKEGKKRRVLGELELNWKNK